MPEYFAHLTNIAVVADSPEAASKIVHGWLLDPCSTWFIDVTDADASLEPIIDDPGAIFKTFNLYESFPLTGKSSNLQ